ncbi:MAG: response regulator transcription factor [Deltaproteobacteria bacterium]|nr:response regulator transcription factor [Deltaproteobacteria bacterium]
MTTKESWPFETPVRALVVEDERPARAYLVELLHSTGQAQVVAAVATESEARQALENGELHLDVAFVDISLASSGCKDAGLAIVRDFSRHDRAPLFVLATAYKQHAMEAFDLDVADYLLKPFTERRVAECLSRITRRRPSAANPVPSRVVARNRNGLVFLPPHEVWAFEASERLAFVHSAAGRFDIDVSLAVMESAMGLTGLRVHRNWVVSTAHILAMEKDELGWTLRVGDSHDETGSALRVPVARDKVQRIRGMLLEGTAGLRR